MRRREYERLERLHREMWRWCAETGLHKFDWPGWKKIKERVSNNCFACCTREETLDCSLCPIKWSKETTGHIRCEFDDSPYWKWLLAQTNRHITTAKKYAAKIAEMPWRPYEPKKRKLL